MHEEKRYVTWSHSARFSPAVRIRCSDTLVYHKNRAKLLTKILLICKLSALLKFQEG